MNFRTDINGLRAYAVLAVIFFHFNKAWLPGGFAGVDVFFVISGYLMTSIIFRGLENNNLSIFRFYESRIKRIVPALLFLVVLLMVFGYLFLAPIPYLNLSEHSASSILFFSNVLYWKESGYFDSSAIEKFLLHTWSLSVEWQFYIAYPIFLLVLSKIFKISLIKNLIAVGVVLGFLFSVYASQKWSVASYFLLPTRVWEMLLGGVAYLYPFEIIKKSEKRILELSGLCLIIVSFFMMTEHIDWPGYAALIPTLGAFFVIQANNEKSIFTNNVVFQKIGLWSYSLYLWHWVWLAIFNHFQYKVNFFLFSLITLCSALFSYFFVEKRRWNVWVVIFAVFVSLVSIFLVYRTDGASFRVDSDFHLTEQEFRNKYEGHIGHPNVVDVTYFNSSDNDFEYILLGNSHARHLFSYIDRNNIKLAEITLDGCISTKKFYTAFDKDRCMKVYDVAESFIRKNPGKKVIISYSLANVAIDRASGDTNTNFLDEFFNSELNYLVDTVLKSNSKVFLIGRTQGAKKNMFSCLNERQLIGPNIFMPSCEERESVENIINNERLENYVLKRNVDNLYYINPNLSLCDNFSCAVLTDELEPVYTDTSHLSTYGANIVGKYIFDEIGKIENNNY